MPMALRPASNSWKRRERERMSNERSRKPGADQSSAVHYAASLLVPHDRRIHSAPASTNWHTASPAHHEKLKEGREIRRTPGKGGGDCCGRTVSSLLELGQ